MVRNPSDSLSPNQIMLVRLGINAGHDLSLDNIQFFQTKYPRITQVSIGHALISKLFI
jgi:pyridoxine 5'-phosphate synthase PdxJ